MIRQGFADAFKECTLLLMPTHPAPAFKFGAFDVDKLQMDLQDYFTCAMNLCRQSGNLYPLRIYQKQFADRISAHWPAFG